MVHQLFERFNTWFNARSRWYLALCAGMLYPLAFAPFNHESHWALTPLPLAGLIVLVPLFYLATISPRRRAIAHTWLFGIGASFFQFYWIANVVADGLWHMIMIGLVAVTLFMALYFLAAGLLFRLVWQRYRLASAPVFAACWVMLELVRGSGEIGFPWNYIGYTVAQILPIAQVASVSGMYGLSFAVVLCNVLIFQRLGAWYAAGKRRTLVRDALILAGVLLAVTGWGLLRMQTRFPQSLDRPVALVQTNIDQGHWGSESMDTALAITRQMVSEAAAAGPELIILPESALFCYLLRRPALKNEVLTWSDSLKIPMILGTLHWERTRESGKRSPDAQSGYDVYNTTYLVDTGAVRFAPYYKMTLLPFSETMPFKGIFPLFNRLNLGSSDFSAGTDPVMYRLNSGLKVVPLICYEVIAAGAVRARVADSADLIVNVTNDGWFGRSTAPFQHALMARMRCVENGISMARCANSGISLVCDQFGRVTRHTGLYERTICHATVNIRRKKTVYTAVGDWPIVLSVAILSITLGFTLSQISRQRSVLRPRRAAE